MNRKDATTILAALDALGVAIPNGYRWPVSLRRAYERAVNMLQKHLALK